MVVLHYADGILFVAENRSQALHKVSEIYDRIAFAAVGRYNEFENLRQAGIRYADVRGYTYDRTDVTARGLANTYAPGAWHHLLLGRRQAGGGDRGCRARRHAALDQIYRLTYDGSVADEANFAVMGGSADVIAAWSSRRSRFLVASASSAAPAALVRGLGSDGGPDATPRALGVEALEVAVLDRTRAMPRKFRRIKGDRLALLADRPKRRAAARSASPSPPRERRHHPRPLSSARSAAS